jgi:hypothetical protein
VVFGRGYDDGAVTVARRPLAGLVSGHDPGVDDAEGAVAETRV